MRALAAWHFSVSTRSPPCLPIWHALHPLGGNAVPATLVMPFDFLRLPVIAVVGLVLYGEPVGPLMLLGATLILGGNYLNIRAEARRPEAA